ncbi:MAG: YARHG domain-containing protein, partial [Oscillospiraceae bacterium]|nr:YARHG domain-containing protein [Oscillospiraceae bacterium]
LVITSLTILFYAYQKNKGIEPNVPTFAYVQTTTDTPKISQTTSEVNSTADTSKISQTTSEVNSTADAPKISQTTSEINSTTDTTLKPYIYSNEYIKIATLNSLNKSEIDSIINEIYARNGYIFSDSENNNNFLSKDWYKPNPNYTDDLLNDVEIGNIFIIEYYEFNKGYITNLKDPNYIKTANPVNDYNSSSDYKWNKEYIKVSFLKTLTEESAVKLRNEIYAWHGFIFQTKWISDYFNGQPWYIPNPNFKPEDLNEIENENIYIIRTHEKKMGWP